MNPENYSASGEESSDCRLGTSAQVNTADLEELIGSVIHQEIVSHLPRASDVSPTGGEFEGGVPN